MNPTVYRKFLPVAASLILLAMLFLGGCTNAPVAKVEKSRYMFWPPAPDTPRIQYLTSISSAADVMQKQTQMEDFLYGQSTSRDLPIERPYGVRIANGKIYVCDASADSVCILDLRKRELRILGVTGPVHLSKPIDIAVAPDDVKYIADTGHGAVMVYDSSDKYAGRIAIPNMKPVSVAVRGDELYVSDMGRSASDPTTIRIFERFKGRPLRTIGQRGLENGQFGGSMGMALDQQGDVYVNDILGGRIQKFSPQGEFQWSIGKLGAQPGQFVRPKLMAVDSEGILYAVDGVFQNVQMFNAKGEFLMYFGGSGTFPGAMDLPTGVCTSDTDLELFAQYVHPAFQARRIVIVTNNTGANRVNIYALGELKPGKTLADIATDRIQGIFGLETQTPADVLKLDPVGDPTTQPATQPAATAPASQPAAPATTRPAGSPGAVPF
jgi:sugar lactone lactonase YvrE